MFLKPFSAGGKTASGISVVHDKRLPPIYGRVTSVHRTCREIKVGDWVVYLPNRPVRLPYSGGVVWSLTEDQVLGIVEAGDGLPWFVNAEAA